MMVEGTFFSCKTSYATSISVLLMFTLNFETCSYHDTITGDAIKTTSLLPSITNSTMTTQINSNVYDLPEPEWITWTLKQYYEYSIAHSKQNVVCGLTGVGSCSSATTTTTTTSGGGGGGGVTGVVPLDFEQSLFDQLGCEEIGIDLPENPMNLPIQFTPNALLIFLSSLAHSSPYPRFSEVVQCAQLTSRRLLTALARYRADCLLLQANLAEIKSNADQMQCQLNQIEANWSVITRAMQVSEGALEVSNCLNQLYSTELAVTIFRQSQNNHLSKHPFSTISSSTSSSSFHGHNKSSQLHHPLSHSHQQHLPSQQTQHHLKRHTSQQMHLIPSSHQPYAIVPLSNSSICSSDEHDVLPITTSATANTIGQQQIPSMNHFNLHTLKSFRQQAEFLAYSILDRYETSDSGGYERILPRSLSNSVNTNIGNLNVTATITSVAPLVTNTNLSLLNNENHQQNAIQSPTSPGICSIQSAVASSNGLLDNHNYNVTTTMNNNNNSIYANSWYVSLNRAKMNAAQQSTNMNQSQHQQLPSIPFNGSIPSVINYQQHQHNNNMRLNNSLHFIHNPRSFLKPAFQGNTNQNMTSGTSGIGGDNGGGCGWETPDSGAGSSSINEISSQQQQQQLHSQQSQQHPSLLLSSSASSLLFGHYYQTYGGVVSNNPTNNNNIISSKLITHSDLHLFNSVLDNLPPLWTLLSKTSTSFYESDLDSSDSSDAPGNFIKSTDLSTHITHNNGCGQPLPQPPPLPHLHNHNYMQLSNWSRIEERKLRTIYCQLIHTYKRLKSMLIDLPSSDQLLTINDTDGRGVETTSSIGPTTGDDNENCKLSTNGSIQQQSTSFNSLCKLPMTVVLENSVLLQELCCVKEECADLKVRVYLLEKELRANRLTLESRAAAERALRAHLDALLTEQNNRQLNSSNDIQKENYTTTTTTTTTQSFLGSNQHETVLLRGQVKNLLQALEALRSSTEIQQVQSEELVNDLKRANSALITAFDKVKRKYTTRIKKLEEQLNSLQSMQSTCSNSSIGKTVPQTMLNTANIHNTTISTTITTTTTTTTSTNNNNHVNNTLDLSKTSSIVNNMHNLNKNIQIHSGIYPNNSSIQQTSTTHSLNRPSFIDYNCELSSIPTSCIPPIPLHHHQPQQQQTTKVNTSQLGTIHQHSSTNLVQSINSKHLPIHH
ncbi:Colorectal mutant cancer isoform 1 [Schistosoma japonicum]|uniref:Colorectal mutant cancer isoform 1 n=2 Tax=Schistosoma japonicum TaxID=6182 RepID=A0A4Z2D993_SCHJA|nr:Colorectal mutant cancer isoform 1 [Schistosoma japonicum]TNN13078.1 Colorectal mutant cancer isoform 1 [Schistosoma japonicum]